MTATGILCVVHIAALKEYTVFYTFLSCTICYACVTVINVWCTVRFDWIVRSFSLHLGTRDTINLPPILNHRKGARKLEGAEKSCKGVDRNGGLELL